ncbi:uncharacterized protein LOC132176670 isoform X1 [Corylus avellana]|uniref:uncharacterized protein LOC132176670 isoform X1 n=1 Tax=Corylus avellana TaxID=13451 RepID=UPI001E23E3F9|nr:uncharacterized protein LOC132176670 isoform X1 [Corylus avellana]
MADAVRVDRDAMRKEHVTDHDRRDKISRILTSIGRFAVDSAVQESLKADTGRKKVHKIVQEGFMHQCPTPCLNDKKKPEDLKLAMEELQAKELMQEDMNKVEQGNKISAKSVNGSEDPEPLKKLPNEDNKESDLLKTDKKRVFLRSRL